MTINQKRNIHKEMFDSLGEGKFSKLDFGKTKLLLEKKEMLK